MGNKNHINPNDLGAILEGICSETLLDRNDSVLKTKVIERMNGNLSYFLFHIRIDVNYSALCNQFYTHPLSSALFKASQKVNANSLGASYFEAGKAAGLTFEYRKINFFSSKPDEKRSHENRSESDTLFLKDRVRKMRFLAACGDALGYWQILLPHEVRFENQEQSIFNDVSNKMMYSMIQYQGYMYLYPR